MLAKKIETSFLEIRDFPVGISFLPLEGGIWDWMHPQLLKALFFNLDNFKMHRH